MPERYAEGMKIRRKVLGDAHVDAAEASTTAFDEPFQALITEAAWGNLWARDSLPLRERSMLTIALLAGIVPEDLRPTILKQLEDRIVTGSAGHLDTVKIEPVVAFILRTQWRPDHLMQRIGQRAAGDLLDVRLQLGRAELGSPGGLLGNDDLRTRLAVFDEGGCSESLGRGRGQAEDE